MLICYLLKLPKNVISERVSESHGHGNRPLHLDNCPTHNNYAKNPISELTLMCCIGEVMQGNHKKIQIP